jgi:hypothetical protein
MNDRDVVANSRSTFSTGMKGLAIGAAAGAAVALAMSVFFMLINAGEGGPGLNVAAGAIFGAGIGLIAGAIRGSRRAAG